MIKFLSGSSAETKRMGNEIGKLLKSGDVVTLQGELGAGKTTLVQGIAKGLGAMEMEVASPTFVLIHEYQGREKIFHIDWCRLKQVEGTDEDMAQECFFSDAVTLVEWPERGEKILPEERFEIKLFHQGENSRLIRFFPRGKKYRDFLKALKMR